MNSKLQTPSQPVTLNLEGVLLQADLTVPPHATGLVIFAHGSGSGRHSPRNRMVAAALQEGQLATLLLDLLSMDEQEIDERNGQFRFDIPLLADRLTGTVDWARRSADLAHLPIGLFGASTGAAAALVAAACRPVEVLAVVSRGGRPDLADRYLPDVQCPVLLIIGGDDEEVIELNRQAAIMLGAFKEMRIIPGATHLFEEPGTLEEVARLAREWFARYLV